MSGEATTLEIPSNGAVDFAKTLSLLAPIFLGGAGSSPSTVGTSVTGGSTTGGTTSNTINSTTGGRQDVTQNTVSGDTLSYTNKLLSSLFPSINGTADTKGIVDNIMRQAAIAFAPVAGTQQTAGMYNSTVMTQMANEAKASATGQAASAVLGAQQTAAQTASSVIGNLMKATGGSVTNVGSQTTSGSTSGTTSNTTNTNQSTQQVSQAGKTNPLVPGGISAAMMSAILAKSLLAPGSGTGTGIAGGLGDSIMKSITGGARTVGDLVKGIFGGATDPAGLNSSSVLANAQGDTDLLNAAMGGMGELGSVGAISDAAAGATLGAEFADGAAAFGGGELATAGLMDGALSFAGPAALGATVLDHVAGTNIMGSITSGVKDVADAVTGGSVLCTYFYKVRRKISRADYFAEVNWAANNYSQAVMEGYWLWAKPTVRFIRKHRWAEPLVQAVVLNYTQEAVHRQNGSRPSCWQGRFIHATLIPLSYLLGWWKLRRCLQGVNARG